MQIMYNIVIFVCEMFIINYYIKIQCKDGRGICMVLLNIPMFRTVNSENYLKVAQTRYRNELLCAFDKLL